MYLYMYIHRGAVDILILCVITRIEIALIEIALHIYIYVYILRGAVDMWILCVVARIEIALIEEL